MSSASPNITTADQLKHLVYNYPLIDNHAHPLLKPEHAHSRPLESIVSEAHGDALKHSENSLAHFRAVKQLAGLLGCNPTWEEIKRARAERDQQEWCRTCFKGIQCVLLDDGLDRETAYQVKEHDTLTKDKNKRVVRIEALAEDILREILRDENRSEDSSLMQAHWARRFEQDLLKEYCNDGVVGFKSVICYRGGLNIRSQNEWNEQGFNDFDTWVQQAKDGNYRLHHNFFNDVVVRLTCGVIADNGGEKPLQFHTGLGDNDINLIKANPAYLETLIKEFPKIPIVLLHSSYPYTREAGYLASVYENVYLDFGEVFPMLSKEGQKSVIKEMLELAPINKLLWSSDGHWFPETYILASLQTREVLYEVLAKWVEDGLLPYEQAANLTKAVLFENSNRLYNLNLEPFWEPLAAPTLSPSLNSATFEQVFTPHKEVKFVRIQWVDYTGTLRLRVLPITTVMKKFKKGWDVSITEAALGILHDDMPASDMSAAGMYDLKPDWSSLRTLTPGPSDTGPQHASVMCDITYSGGAVLPLCPRSALRNAVSLAASTHGIEFLVGFETEVVFFDRSPTGSLITSTPNAHFWSTATALTPKRLSCLEEISANLEAAGIELLMFHPESADGQFEIVTGPLPPLAAVDALYSTRQIIATTAARHGMHATLHPKPFANQPGTSSHMHFSLLRSDLEFNFVAGVLQHLKALAAVSMPSVASYDRLADNCWAGGTWVCWGQENRETPLRRIKGGSPRWEFRAIDGTANMYLVLTVLIQAGLLGIEGKEEISMSCEKNPADLTQADRDVLGIKDKLPASLTQALRYFDEDEQLKKALGDSLVRKFMVMKDGELKRMNTMPEENRWRWEVERY